MIIGLLLNKLNGVLKMVDLYKYFSAIYDECNVSTHSIIFGKSMLRYFEIMHPNESFKKNLDLCCGTGSLCNFLMENGIESKGVDLSEEMLEIALKNYPDIEFVHCNIIDYKDHEKYDFITSTDDALNHIIEIDDLKKSFQNANNLLRKDGLFIFDISNFNQVSFKRREKFSEGSKKLVYSPSKKGKIVNYKVEYYENDEFIWSDDINERDYSVDEIIGLLNDTGFVLEVCAQYFFDENRMAKFNFVARKIS